MLGDTINSSLFYRVIARWYLWLLMVRGILRRTSAEDVATVKSTSTYPKTDMKSNENITIVMIYLFFELFINYYQISIPHFVKSPFTKEGRLKIQ